MKKGSEVRLAEYKVNKIFTDRWSPRAMSGEPLKEEELFRLFEAARWAPSSMNNQPWRILYAKRDSETWPTFFNLLVDANKVWAEKAAVLLIFISKTTFDFNGKTYPTHSFDTGAAWENMALQGSLDGLVVHGMMGFSYERAEKELGIPGGFKIEAMAALGKPGNADNLPENLAKREFPSDRRPLNEIAKEGLFSF